MLRKAGLIAAALSVALSSTAMAAVSQAEADKLGNSLTPLGGEAAANADGSIPA